jgi:hypothetical protein
MCEDPHRLQLRGQLRIWSLWGIPHRIPFSAMAVSTNHSTIKGDANELKRAPQA